MAQAIICAKCGSKVRPGRERCPRCRAFITVPDPARAAAASKRLATIAAGVAGAFVLLLVTLWFVRGSAPSTVPARTATVKPSPPPAAEAAPASQPAAPLPPIARDRAFLDPSGAGAAAYGAGDYATSLAQFQAAIEKNPQDADSLSNLGQVLVFPGFVNLVCVFVAIDLVASAVAGDYPTVAQTAGREVLIGSLGVVHLVHQVRAAAQGFQILRRLR